MIINGDNLRAAGKSFRALFVATLTAAALLHPELAMVIDSNDDQEDYSFLADLPGLREWVGERVIHNLKAAGFTIKNKKWESTIAVERNAIERDKLGLVKPRIQEMATSAGRHPDKLLFDLVANGFTNLCYDGQYFFDTDHPVTVDGEVVSKSNKGTATLGAPGALSAAIAEMMSQVGEGGDPREVMPTHLVVPPQLRETALLHVNAETIEGTSNPNRGALKVVVAQRLAAHPTKWFLLDCSGAVRPFIVQVLTKPEFTAMDRPDDEAVFMRDEFRYGIRAEHNAGYGLWQLAWGSTGTG